MAPLVLTRWNMSSKHHGNVVCITGPLQGESTVTGQFPSQSASNAEFWCLLWCQPEQAVKQVVELVVIRDGMVLMWHHCNGLQRPTRIEVIIITITIPQQGTATIHSGLKVHQYCWLCWGMANLVTIGKSNSYIRTHTYTDPSKYIINIL